MEVWGDGGLTCNKRAHIINFNNAIKVSIMHVCMLCTTQEIPNLAVTNEYNPLWIFLRSG